MSVTLKLPPLCGMRARAKAVTQDVPRLADEVKIDCADLLACTGGFVDELVRQLLVERTVGVVTVIRLSDSEFSRFLDRQAAAHGVQDRVRVFVAS